MDADKKVEAAKPDSVTLIIPANAARGLSAMLEAGYHSENVRLTAWVQLIVAPIFIAMGIFCVYHALIVPADSSETDLFFRYFDKLLYGPLGLIALAVGVPAFRTGMRLKAILDQNADH